MTPAHLKALRTKLGWSQARLAEQLGVRSNTVARWEQGVHPISPLVTKLLATLATKKTRRTS